MSEQNSLEYNLVTLEHALKIVARIVTKYGDKYLPFFERLFTEVETLKNQNRLLHMAEMIARED